MTAVLLASSVLITLAWITMLARFRRAARDFPELTPSSPRIAPRGPAPLVSIIVAAKDEADNIAPCVESLLAQSYSQLELVVVDDRSSDATPQLLQRLAGRDSRLRVLTISELPAGWGGQNHALRRGVEASHGQWLCFTDADCTFDCPHTLSIALAEARSLGANLLSLLPEVHAGSAWQRVVQPLAAFMLLTMLRILRVNRPDDPAAYANGAFMLLDRGSYELIGGHAAVRDYINDDVRLAELAKQRGLRLGVSGSRGLLQTRMYATLREAWHGWTRNFHGAVGHPRRLALAAATVLGLLLAPALACGFALGVGGAAAVACAVPLLIAQLGLWQLYRAFAVPPQWSLAYLPGACLVLAILLRAWLRARRGAQTDWHGARYRAP